MKEKIDIFTYVNINSYMTEILKQSKKTRHTLAEGVFNPYNLEDFFFFRIYKEYLLFQQEQNRNSSILNV